MKHYTYQLSTELVSFFVFLMKNNLSITYSVAGDKITMTDARTKLKTLLKEKELSMNDINHLLEMGTISECSKFFVDVSKSQ